MVRIFLLLEKSFKEEIILYLFLFVAIFVVVCFVDFPNNKSRNLSFVKRHLSVKYQINDYLLKKDYFSFVLPFYKTDLIKTFNHVLV